jgi:hypothetical protein
MDFILHSFDFIPSGNQYHSALFKIQHLKRAVTGNRSFLSPEIRKKEKLKKRAAPAKKTDRIIKNEKQNPQKNRTLPRSF